MKLIGGRRERGGAWGGRGGGGAREGGPGRREDGELRAANERVERGQLTIDRQLTGSVQSSSLTYI